LLSASLYDPKGRFRRLRLAAGATGRLRDLVPELVAPIDPGERTWHTLAPYAPSRHQDRRLPWAEQVEAALREEAHLRELPVRGWSSRVGAPGSAAVMLAAPWESRWCSPSPSRGRSRWAPSPTSGSVSSCRELREHRPWRLPDGLRLRRRAASGPRAPPQARAPPRRRTHRCRPATAGHQRPEGRAARGPGVGAPRDGGRAAHRA